MKHKNFFRKLVHKAKYWANLPEIIQQSARTSNDFERDYILRQLRTLGASQEIARILSEPRYQNPLRLEQFEHKCYSQHGEDGIIQEIFKRIGIKKHIFVEFGVGDGLENNTLFLLKQGWKGMWIEGSEENAQIIRERFNMAIHVGQLNFMESFITRENINQLIGSCFTGEIDLLSIDIDGNDYYIWEAIDIVSPRLLIIEYNAKFKPPVKWTIEYNPKHTWDYSDYQGASLAALAELGEKKGYHLVACNLNGTNAFFVRNDELDGKFLTSDDLMDFYHPPRYYLFEGYLLMAGHKPNARMGRSWK